MGKLASEQGGLHGASVRRSTRFNSMHRGRTLPALAEILPPAGAVRHQRELQGVTEPRVNHRGRGNGGDKISTGGAALVRWPTMWEG